MADEQFSGTAYSYIRFSSREQERGDSIRRQRQIRDDWLKKNPAVVLDTTLGGEDRGVSAFRGRNRSDKHHLGRFLEAVRLGRVPPGSILLLESLDRLSRQEEEEALAVLLSLLNVGLIIVQLEPYTVFRRGDGMIGLMRALIYLSRAREESATKSMRMTNVWRHKQKSAAETKAVVSGRCPAWLEGVNAAGAPVAAGERPVGLRFKPGARAVVARIFARCAAGQGARMIAHDLHAEGVEHFEGGTWWHSTYVGSIVRNPATFGRYQAMHRVNGKRVPNGPPVDDYFPAAVTLDQWQAAQKAMRERRKRGGRRGAGGWVALFEPPIDARTGDRLHAIVRVDRGRRYRVLQQAGVARWQGKCVSFPLSSFEAAISLRLSELDLSDVFPAPSGEGQSSSIGARLIDVESRIARLQAAMVGGDQDETALPVLRQLGERRKQLAAELAVAKADESIPARRDGEELRDRAAIESDPEVRLRYRAAAARVIESIHVLIVTNGKRGGPRLAAVQVRFRNSAAVRTWVISHTNANHGPGGTQTPESWDEESEKQNLPACDLRLEADVKRLESVLAKML